METLTIDKKYIEMTGDFMQGVVLNYLVENFKNENEFELNFKKIIEETMLNVSVSTLRRIIKDMVSKGLIIEIKGEVKYKYKLNIQGENKEIEDINDEKGIVKNTKSDVEKVKKVFRKSNKGIVENKKNIGSSYNKNSRKQKKIQNGCSEFFSTLIKRIIKYNLSFKNNVYRNYHTTYT